MWNNMVEEISNLLNTVDQVNKKEDEGNRAKCSGPRCESLPAQWSNAYTEPGSIKNNIMDTVNDQGFPTNFHNQWWDIFENFGNPDKEGKNDQHMAQAPKTGIVVGRQFKLSNASEVKTA